VNLVKTVATALSEGTTPATTGVVRAVIESVEAERLSHMVAGNPEGLAGLCDERLNYSAFDWPPGHLGIAAGDARIRGSQL